MSVSEALTKIKSNKGMYLPSFQVTDTSIERTEAVIIHSATAPSWGSSFVINSCEDPNVLILENTIAFRVPGLQGMTSEYPSYVPAAFFIDHVDYIIGGNIVETYFGDDLFLIPNLYERDEDRFAKNKAMGRYDDVVYRNALANGDSLYMVSMPDFYKQSMGHFPVISPSHRLQMKVFLRPFAEVVIGEGSPVLVQPTCHLIQRVIRLRDQEVTHLRNQMFNQKHLDFNYSDIVRQTYTLQAGASDYTFNLQSFNGRIHTLMFFLRTPSASRQDLFTYNGIGTWEILNGSGQNIVGGSPIGTRYSLLLNGNRCSKSTFQSEAYFPVHLYSFSATPHESMVFGAFDGAYKFTGSETMRVTIPVQQSDRELVVIAFREAVMNVSQSGVKPTMY